MAGLFRTVLAYRGFIAGSVKREFQSKYRNSLLGVSWTVLNPLAMIVVYTVIFSQVMKAKLPGVDNSLAYSVYLCSGVLTWGLFAEIVGRGQNIFIDNANLLKKINFPRICLPIIVVLSAVFNFSIIFGLFLTFLLISGLWPGWVSLAVLPVLIVEVLFAIGLGMTLGVLNVFFRDVGQFFGIFIQFWFWLTPIVYPVSVLPQDIRNIIELNPMVPLVNAYQNIFVTGLWPEWQTMIYPGLSAMMLCGLGICLFRRHASEMVDEL